MSTDEIRELQQAIAELRENETRRTRDRANEAAAAVGLSADELRTIMAEQVSDDRLRQAVRDVLQERDREIEELESMAGDDDDEGSDDAQQATDGGGEGEAEGAGQGEADGEGGDDADEADEDDDPDGPRIRLPFGRSLRW